MLFKFIKDKRPIKINLIEFLKLLKVTKGFLLIKPFKTLGLSKTPILIKLLKKFGLPKVPILIELLKKFAGVADRLCTRLQGF